MSRTITGMTSNEWCVIGYPSTWTSRSYTVTVSESSYRRIMQWLRAFRWSAYVEDTHYEFPRADGSTYGDQIDDWRVQFRCYTRDRRDISGAAGRRYLEWEPSPPARSARRGAGYLPRLTAVVEAFWDDLEAWHAEHGSLDTPIMAVCAQGEVDYREIAEGLVEEVDE
jgi:hypothetical protein